MAWHPVLAIIIPLTLSDFGSCGEKIWRPKVACQRLLLWIASAVAYQSRDQSRAGLIPAAQTRSRDRDWWIFYQGPGLGTSPGIAIPKLNVFICGIGGKGKDFKTRCTAHLQTCTKSEFIRGKLEPSYLCERIEIENSACIVSVHCIWVQSL